MYYTLILKSKEVKLTISPHSLKFESLGEAGTLQQKFEVNEFKTTKTDKSPEIFEIGFNTGFIKAAIGDKSQDLNMVFNSSNMPFMVKNDDAFTVIMPIFLR